ncbi:MAG: membrane protein insertase YidC [Treponema sp.]|jgi:YidC/Oxa1 family membrane protein insertase|nr:membrane protein insertase YidC [Treponema sp.]
MEKKTILFVVLSALIFIGFYLLQSYLYPPQNPETVQDAPALSSPNAVTDEIVIPSGPDMFVAEEFPAEESGVQGRAAEEQAEEQIVVIETDLIRVTFTNAGGDMVSYQLLKHNDKGENVEMVLGGSAEPRAFTIAFGDRNAAPVKSLFRVNRPSPLVVEFSRDFPVSGGGAFTLTKRYDFRPDEYMFGLTVSLDSASPIPLNINGAAYTLGFGPQIGPRFTKLDNRYEYRHNYVFSNNKRRQIKADELIDSRFTWAGIAGKYFAAMVVPDNTLYQLSFSSKAEDGLPDASRFYMVRPALSNARTSDTYHFYLGPKNQENLGKYDTGINSFGIRDLQFIKASNTSGFLSPLENLLKLLLQFFYRLIPNYGVAIILLTLLVKIVLFPLTKKSSEASIKMQALAPKIKELQTKYKDNPAKLNAEMGALYKKEGHNPMSGCLPLLIQMPLLFAMYNLFNTHFDLRGALFIPQWIPDLSLPEAIWTFGSSLPLLGWNSLRLLPFIYLGSQLLYGLVTRTPEQQGNSSMAMMMYVMPIMFFFILYDVPSGLLVFWIFSNLFTLIQQVALNRILAKKRAAAALEEPEPVIAPRRKKKR